MPIQVTNNPTTSRLLGVMDRFPILQERVGVLDAPFSITNARELLDIDLTTSVDTTYGPDPMGLFTYFRLNSERSLANLNGRKNPLKNLYTNPLSVDEIATDLGNLAVRHNEFFERLDTASESISRLDALVQDMSDNYTPVELSALMNAYKELDWGKFVEFYEHIESIGIQLSDSVHADYVYGLNRVGRNREAIDEATKVVKPFLDFVDIGTFPSHNAPGVEDYFDTEIISEHIIGIATAHKEAWVAAKRVQDEIAKGTDGDVTLELRDRYIYFFPEDTNLQLVDENSTSALDFANKAYTLAFYANPSYYPGINVIHTFLFQGELDKAKAFAPLVRHAALEADWRNNFWPQAALCELAILEGNDQDIGRWLPALTSNAHTKEPTEVASLTKHLRLWAENDPDNREFLRQVAQLLDGSNTLCIGIEERPGFSQSELSRYTKVEDAIVAYSQKFGASRRGTLSDFTSGGLVPRLRNGPTERRLARQIITYSGALAFMGDQVKSLHSLSKIEDVDHWIEAANTWVNQYVEYAFRLRDPESGTRKVERMDNIEHLLLEGYWTGILDLTQRNVSGLSGTSITNLPAVGMGDCRHVNFFKAYLLSECIRYEKDKVKQEATAAFLREGPNSSTLKAAIARLYELSKVEVVMFQAQTKANIAVYDKNDVDRNQKKGDMQRNSDGIAIHDSSVENIVDRHAMPALIKKNDDGSIKQFAFIDGWYHGEEDDLTFRMKHAIVEGENLESLLKNGYFIVPDGARVADRETGERFDIPIKIVVRPYSGPTTSRFSTKHDVQSHSFVAHSVVEPDWELFFHPDRRDQLLTDFIHPIAKHGFEIMMQNADKDPVGAKHAREYLEKLQTN